MSEKVNWMIENWYFILTALVMVGMAGTVVFNFFSRPSKEQVNAIKKWLLYAVMEAERQMGGGTGQLKLRSVYDMFVGKFPAAAMVISFDTFSSWVDAALEEMKEMLDTNAKAAAYVEGDAENE